MPEVIIKYEDPKTLKVLEELSKSMNFEINNSEIKKTELQKAIDAITVPADKEADLSQLFEVFTGKDIDAKTLRKELWRTKK